VRTSIHLVVQHFHFDYCTNINRKYGWERAVIVYEVGGCNIGANAILKAFAAHNITIDEHIPTEEALSDRALDSALDKIQRRGRSEKITHSSFLHAFVFPLVVLLCFLSNTKQRFFYRALERGMASSDYAYLSWWLLPDEYVTNPWQREDEITDPVELRQAFYFFKQVSLCSLFVSITTFPIIS
jgi:hypothetical protein